MITLLCSSSAAAPSTIIFVGTYTGSTSNDSQGIYAFDFNDTTGALKPLGLAMSTPNPSYILRHPSRPYLYAVQEDNFGQIHAFEIDQEHPGRLNGINQQPSIGGGPCHLSTDRVGDHLFVANYNDGTVTVLPINEQDGSLKIFTAYDQHIGSSIDRNRQNSAHAHCFLLDNNEEYAFSADLGTDEIYTYRFHRENSTFNRYSISATAHAGAGPRHLLINRNNEYVYVLNELQSSITVYRFQILLYPVQTISTVPADFVGNNTGAEILFHPFDEKYLYVSNRGHDSIAVFAIHPYTGHLSLQQHIHTQGRTPRHFHILPSGKYLLVANQDSNNLAVFNINSLNGLLTETPSIVSINRPTCITDWFYPSSS